MAQPVVKVDRRIRWHYTTTIILYFAFALVHNSRGIEIVNFTISLALSAGTLMASAGTRYHLVPAHFYPCRFLYHTKAVVDIRLRPRSCAAPGGSVSVHAVVSNPCCPMLSNFEYTPFRVAHSWPLCAQMTSSINRKYISCTDTLIRWVDTSYRYDASRP